MKKLRIGICGWGNVATGLFNTIENNNKFIKSNGNLEIEIVVIGARRDNPKCNPGKVEIVRDIFDVLDKEIDVVVELIGGVEVARELILKAIRNKKHVVTANKAVIFNHGDEIIKEAKAILDVEDVITLSLIHICRCRRSTLCRSRWSPYH